MINRPSVGVLKTKAAIGLRRVSPTGTRTVSVHGSRAVPGMAGAPMCWVNDCI